MSINPSKGSGLKWNSRNNLQDNSSHLAWKLSITTFLKAEDLYDIVTGNWPAPRKRDFTNTKEDIRRCNNRSREWRLADAKATTLLTESVCQSIMITIGSLNSAKECWDYLEQTYNSKSWGTWVTVRDDFNNAKYVEGTNMQDHISPFDTNRRQALRCQWHPDHRRGTSLCIALQPPRRMVIVQATILRSRTTMPLGSPHSKLHVGIFPPFTCSVWKQTKRTSPTCFDDTSSNDPNHV